MLNYIGKYRVDYERDVTGYAMESSYIKCKASGEIYRYNSDTLCLYLTSVQRGRKIEETLSSKIKSIEYSDEEARIYFHEKYLNEFAELGGAMTKGKNKKPVKNIRPKIEVKPEQKKHYKYRVMVNKKLYKDNLSLLDANKLLTTLKKSTMGEVTREKYEIKG